MAGCQECGHVHPYTAPGMCPIANAAKLEAGITDEGQKAATEQALVVQKKFTDKFNSLTSDAEKTELCDKIIKILEE